MNLDGREGTFPSGRILIAFRAVSRGLLPSHRIRRVIFHESTSGTAAMCEIHRNAFAGSGVFRAGNPGCYQPGSVFDCVYGGNLLLFRYAARTEVRPII